MLTGPQHDSSIPRGFHAYTESSTAILVEDAEVSSSGDKVFVNPVQQFNRDLSVLAIDTWAELRNQDKNGKTSGKRRKVKNTDDSSHAINYDEPREFKVTIMEAFSASGIRALRYAQEIPLLRYVVANDVSADAVKSIQRNLEFNARKSPAGPANGNSVENNPPLASKIQVSQGDANEVLFRRRYSESQRFDCVDLDPYGTAAPFLDASINALSDGGLLCVTCTDSAVWAGHNYPEKAYSLYGGVCVHSMWSHELGLRLLLHAIASTAAKYGKFIEPLASFSIDFYLRVFVKVTTGPNQVKSLASQTGLVYNCSGCFKPSLQFLGRTRERLSKKGDPIRTYHMASASIPSNHCAECGSVLVLAGPLWLAPIHNKSFVSHMLEKLQRKNESGSPPGTFKRLEGMLTVVLRELDVPFYFSPSAVASHFHCSSIASELVFRALLNAGYEASLTHASAGAIKTNAPWSFIHDIFRKHIETHPVNLANIKESSPSRALVTKARVHDIDFDTVPPQLLYAMVSDIRVVRHQMNPTANWGPGRLHRFNTESAKKE